MREPQSTRHYRKRRQRITEALGSKCNDCGAGGTGPSMRLYHNDPELRGSFSFSVIQQLSWGDIERHLRDVKLLCNSCFRERNDGRDPGHSAVPHGGGTAGRKNCPCKPCRDAKNAYMRAWRREKKQRLLAG